MRVYLCAYEFLHPPLELKRIFWHKSTQIIHDFKAYTQCEYGLSNRKLSALVYCVRVSIEKKMITKLPLPAIFNIWYSISVARYYVGAVSDSDFISIESIENNMNFEFNAMTCWPIPISVV